MAADSGLSVGMPRPDGSIRRWLLLRAVRHAFVAIRYSQVRSEERPSKPSYPRHARIKVSWTRSSASCSEPSMR